MKKYLFITISAICLSLLSLQTALADERQLPLEPGTDRLILRQSPGGVELLTSRRIITTLTQPIRSINVFLQLAIERYAVSFGPTDVRISDHTSLRTKWFYHWTLIEPTTGNPLLVSSDMEGTDTLEQPNNPMARLWLLPVAFHPPAPVPATVNTDEARAEHKRIVAQGTVSYVRLNPQHDDYMSYTRVDGLATVLAGDHAWTCVGLTAEKALWTKVFTVNPSAWQQESSVIEGPFTQFAVTPLTTGMLVVAGDRTGAVEAFRAPTAGSLANATRSTIIPGTRWAHGEYLRKIMVATRGDNAVLGLVVERLTREPGTYSPASRVSELRFWSYRAATTEWEPLTNIVPLTGPVVDMAMIMHEGVLKYAYIYLKDEMPVCVLGQIWLP